MLQTIKKLLLGIVDDIDVGNTDIDEKVISDARCATDEIDIKKVFQLQ